MENARHSAWDVLSTRWALAITSRASWQISLPSLFLSNPFPPRLGRPLPVATAYTILWTFASRFQALVLVSSPDAALQDSLELPLPPSVTSLPPGALSWACLLSPFLPWLISASQPSGTDQMSWAQWTLCRLSPPHHRVMWAAVFPAVSWQLVSPSDVAAAGRTRVHPRLPDPTEGKTVLFLCISVPTGFPGIRPPSTFTHAILHPSSQQ